MPFGRTQGWKALQNDTPNYVILIEPPDADPHVRWCERGRLITAPYSISRDHFITVGKSMRRIVTNDRFPLTFPEAFQLHDKRINLSAFYFKMHTQGIIVLQKSAELNETVEKHKYDRTYYTQSRDFNFQLGNNPNRQFDHCLAHLNAIRSSQLANP